MVVAPKNVLSACYVVVKETVNELNLSPDVTIVEPPEVAASAAEPPEVSVVPSCESLSCPSMAMEAVDDSSSCPVAAIKAICEPWLRPELTTEVINEPPFAHATAYQLLTCPESAEEAGCVFPVPSVTTEGVTGELPDCYIAPLGAACELLPPPVINSEIINAPQSSVYLITTMKSSNEPSVCSVIPVIVKKNNSKLPWLPALPQSPVSPFAHGPGPPSLPLFHLRSTSLLDRIGASGSRSLGGGGSHQRSLLHHIDFSLHTGCYMDYNSHHPLH